MCFKLKIRPMASIIASLAFVLLSTTTVKAAPQLCTWGYISSINNNYNDASASQYYVNMNMNKQGFPTSSHNIFTLVYTDTNNANLPPFGVSAYNTLITNLHMAMARRLPVKVESYKTDGSCVGNYRELKVTICTNEGCTN
ncbi:hypothetical protein [Chania multitudinisentens]|uniref:hypothetical protein n=1 Tax=Chania multitudinisentens TaxID=1639108 RepID=UPI0012B59D42|nr:hypothetical protein [Chania multitudinisentens]